MKPILLLLISSLAGAVELPSNLRELLPTGVDLNHSKYQSAKAELLSEIESCGPGVVMGAKDGRGREAKNKCSYQIKMDGLFFTDLQQKTGLLHDPNWAYQEGETWYVPSELETPERFDVRDLMKKGIPEIKQQQCGDCWAWSTHHGLEIARAIFEQNPLDLSIQTVLSCSKSGSCSGGYMSAPLYLVKRGLPEEAQFPYRGSNAPCKFSTAEQTTGWEGKIYGAPNIGESTRYSRAFRKTGYREGTKVQEIMAAIYQARSPAVVTVSSYSISGDGIYDSCSAINSGGNHMVAISGWEMVNGKRIAHVWNSHGKDHGKDGVSRIQWECGDGKLNRGLGVSARVIQYLVPCKSPEMPELKARVRLERGKKQILGKAVKDATCRWLPREGLSSPDSCETEVLTSRATEYHLAVSNKCGTVSAMTLVDPVDTSGRVLSDKILTPFGEVSRD